MKQQQRAEIQKKCIQDIINLNTYFTVKTGSLCALLKGKEASLLPNIINNLHKTEKALNELLTWLEPKEGESEPERKLRQRGAAVLFSDAKELMETTQFEMIKLSLSLPFESYSERERHNIARAINSIMIILGANIYMIGDREDQIIGNF